MKKYIVIFTALFWCKLAVSQHLDSVYYFKPLIVPSINGIKMSDSPFLKKTRWQFKRDSSDQKILKVAIYHNDSLVQEGAYSLARTDTAYVHTIYRDGRPIEKIPSRLNLTYLRNGYWNYYSKGKKKSIYYFEGKPLNEK